MGAGKPATIFKSFSPANSGSGSPETVISPSGSPAVTGSELNVTPIAIASHTTKRQISLKNLFLPLQEYL